MNDVNIKAVEISDERFRQDLDKLYVYIMSHGYRFNTNIGAQFFTLLYRHADDHHHAYDFMMRWEKEGEHLQLNYLEKLYMRSASDMTGLRQRLANGTNQGIVEAVKGPCGRRLVLRTMVAGAATVALAPFVERAENALTRTEEQSECSEKGTKEIVEQEQSWLAWIKEQGGKEWLHYALSGVTVTSLALGFHRFMGERDEKRDVILDELADFCRSQRVAAQLPREGERQRA